MDDRSVLPGGREADHVHLVAQADARRRGDLSQNSVMTVLNVNASGERQGHCPTNSDAVNFGKIRREAHQIGNRAKRQGGEWIPRRRLLNTYQRDVRDKQPGAGQLTFRVEKRSAVASDNYAGIDELFGVN